MPTADDPTLVTRSFDINVSAPDGWTVTVTSSQGASKDFTVQGNVLMDGANRALFLFVPPASGTPNLATTTIKGQPVTVITANEGDQIIAKFQKAPDTKTTLTVLDPHTSGDYSTDASTPGKDATGSNAAHWEKTRYYYTVELSYPIYPTDASIPDAGFNNDTINYLNMLHLVANPSVGTQQSGSSTIKYEVDRYIPTEVAGPGPGTPSGVPNQAAVNNGVISAQAHVRFVASAKSGSSDYTMTCNLNGSSSRTFKLSPNVPQVCEFDVPVSSLKVPTGRELSTFSLLGAPTSVPRPTAAVNQLSINCSANYMVHWAELSFDCMSPYVLIHGKGSNSWYWYGKHPLNGTTLPRDSAPLWNDFATKFIKMGIPYDCGICLGVHAQPALNSQDFIKDQSDELKKYLPWVAKAYARSAECFEKLGKKQEAGNTYREMLRNQLAACDEGLHD